MKIVYQPLLIIVSFHLFGCSTIFKKDFVKESPNKYFYSDSKMVINDLKNKSSQSLSAEIFILKDDKLRLEISGPMNYTIGSILIDNSEFKMILYNKKRYYYGKLSNEVLTPIIPLSINPKILASVLLDEFQSSKDWKCKDVAGPNVKVYKKCTNQDLGLNLIWKRAEDNKKKVIDIKSKSYEIAWLVDDFSTEVEYRKQVFSVEPPPDFKLIQLQ